MDNVDELNAEEYVVDELNAEEYVVDELNAEEYVKIFITDKLHNQYLGTFQQQDNNIIISIFGYQEELNYSDATDLCNAIKLILSNNNDSKAVTLDENGVITVEDCTMNALSQAIQQDARTRGVKILVNTNEPTQTFTQESSVFDKEEEEGKYESLDSKLVVNLTAKMCNMHVGMMVSSMITEGTHNFTTPITENAKNKIAHLCHTSINADAVRLQQQILSSTAKTLQQLENNLLAIKKHFLTSRRQNMKQYSQCIEQLENLNNPYTIEHRQQQRPHTTQQRNVQQNQNPRLQEEQKRTRSQRNYLNTSGYTQFENWQLVGQQRPQTAEPQQSQHIQRWIQFDEERKKENKKNQTRKK